MWIATPSLGTLLALAVAVTGAGCHQKNGSTAGELTESEDNHDREENAPGESDSDDPWTLLRPGDPGVVDVLFEVNVDRDAKPISPLIYGMAIWHADPDGPYTVIRSGGNRMTAFNWENNASNAGADWQFQNDGLIESSNEPGKAMLDFLDAAKKMSAKAIVTIPNVDWVAADKKGDGDVRKSGDDYLKKRFKRNHATKGKPFELPPNVKDDHVYQDEFVAFLKKKRPEAEVLFSMDNEPALWSHTHAEVHPEPVTYAELWKRNREYALAVKAVWPEAEVLGPAAYGYASYMHLQNAKDAGGRDFLEWYLDQARAAEKKDGKRLIDYLDLHWYPEARGGGERINVAGSKPEVTAARVQAPRSLWDPTYQEQSWISETLGGPIKLLPRVQQKIEGHYPGTKLAFTEWCYGGGQDMSGGVAVADVLGIFGRNGVDLATYWPLAKEETYSFAAFRAYRDYDGEGSQFGDTSVWAKSSRVEIGSVYASIDAEHKKRVVVIAINRAADERTAGLEISHSSVYPRAKTYVLAEPQPKMREGKTLEAVGTNAFRFEMPGRSVTVIVPQPVK